MSKIKINNLACRKFFSGIPDIFLLLIFIFVGYVPLSVAQSCSVTTIEKDKAIRACQIEDMRTLINNARAACVYGAIPPYPFSDDPIMPNRTAISRRHMNEFATAINEISTRCGPARPTTNFHNVQEGDVIKVSDYVNMYNEFIATDFCGDSICQTTYESLTSCPVDCGGSAQFYCNGTGGCFAAVSCPAGKTCYPVLQDCLNNSLADCNSCVPNCSGAANRATCEFWNDGCGGLCWGTKDVSCACASSTCVGNNCTDACGNVCPGAKVPDTSCASTTCAGQTCSDGCGGVVVGTAASTCSCASNTCVGNTCVDECGVTCAGTKPADCSCAANTCVGNSCIDVCGGMSCQGAKAPDCSACGWNQYFDSRCNDGCGGDCLGTYPRWIFVEQNCPNNGQINVRWFKGNFPTLDGYYVYRCPGVCTPTEANRVTSLLPISANWVDTGISVGQTYTYAMKPHFTDRDPGVFSQKMTFTLTAGSASCACAASTCVGSSCSNGCGGTCQGTKLRSCACASGTCVGDVCSDGCGGTCQGTKNCNFAPIECKKWSCSARGFCNQDHTETCSCPSGQKPVCERASRISCGGGVTCPDTMCRCVN